MGTLSIFLAGSFVGAGFGIILYAIVVVGSMNERMGEAWSDGYHRGYDDGITDSQRGR